MAELLLKYVLFVLIVAPQELVKMQHIPKPLAQLPEDVPPGIKKTKTALIILDNMMFRVC